MRLKLNGDKTEFMLIGCREQLKKCVTSSIHSDRNLIPVSNIVRYLGAHLDHQLSFKHHVSEKCRFAMANIIGIRNVRQFLNRVARETLMHGLCISHLDYSNPILYSLPAVTLYLSPGLFELNPLQPPCSNPVSLTWTIRTQSSMASLQ